MVPIRNILILYENNQNKTNSIYEGKRTIICHSFLVGNLFGMITAVIIGLNQSY